MRMMIHCLSFAALIACAQNPKKAHSPFGESQGCFLLYNLKTNTLEQTIGETCQQRFPACSTFKVPLSVMAFDAKVLKSEKEVYKWDGQKRMLEAWNKNHNAESWMRESVVWFSQRLTPKLGEKRVQNYLNEFDYGNKNIHVGLTDAWLNPAHNPDGALAINAFEQLEFIKKLWRNELKASLASMEITRRITYLETSTSGFKLSGKTGSNVFDEDKKRQFGWFISHVSNGDKEYIAITNIKDVQPAERTSFGGLRAKEITKNLLKQNGLWD